MICNPKERRSALETSVHNALQASFPDLDYNPEGRALGGFSGQIDFVFWSERILIQVDGATHYTTVRKAKAKVTNQPDVDQRCCERALELGWNLLRIHERDIPSCQFLIEEFVGVVRNCMVGIKDKPWLRLSSVTWSPAFGKKPSVRVRKVGEEG